MILDTTYLLPLARIAIDTDLLGAMAEGRTDLEIEEVGINLISIFELQAKAKAQDTCKIYGKSS